MQCDATAGFRSDPALDLCEDDAEMAWYESSCRWFIHSVAGLPVAGGRKYDKKYLQQPAVLLIGFRGDC